MKKKQILFCGLVLIITVLSGCNFLEKQIAADTTQIESKEVLIEEVKKALAEGQEEVSFGTKTLLQQDMDDLNEYHDGFYGTVSGYSFQSFQFIDYAKVSLHLEINENYYVEQFFLHGAKIPEKEERANALLEVCDSIVMEMEKRSSCYEKEKFIHDYLVKNIVYGYPEGKDRKDSTGYTAYGALVQGKAVCNGYAQAFQLLCDLGGIECNMICGQADGENHAWNQVCLEEEWYHVDVTWDDPTPDRPDRILYTYFNLNDKQMAYSHQWDEGSYVKAEGKKYQYYFKKGRDYKNIKEFESDCAVIFEESSPETLQILVEDYEEELYSEQRLQFIFRYSGADSMRVEVVGDAPHTTLYITLDY